MNLFVFILFRYFRAVLVNALLGVTGLKFRQQNLRLLLSSLVRCFHDMVRLIQQVIMDPVVDRMVGVTCSLAAHLCRLVNIEIVINSRNQFRNVKLKGARDLAG